MTDSGMGRAGSPDRRDETGGTEVGRASQQVLARLATLGIQLDGDTDVDALAEISDAVDGFEEAVRARGGDLMVDEPPAGKSGQPDERDFALPRPRADETTAAWLGRLQAATKRVLQHSDSWESD